MPQPQDFRAPPRCTPTETNNQDNNTSSLQDDAPYFGHAPLKVPNGCFRVGSVNVANLPIYKSEAKNEQLFRHVLKYDLDILLMQEVGVNWAVLAPQDGWHQRLHDFFEPNLPAAG